MRQGGCLDRRGVGHRRRVCGGGARDRLVLVAVGGGDCTNIGRVLNSYCSTKARRI